MVWCTTPRDLLRGGDRCGGGDAAASPCRVVTDQVTRPLLRDQLATEEIICRERRQEEWCLVLRDVTLLGEVSLHTTHNTTHVHGGRVKCKCNAAAVFFACIRVCCSDHVSMVGVADGDGTGAEVVWVCPTDPRGHQHRSRLRLEEVKLALAVELACLLVGRRGVENVETSAALRSESVAVERLEDADESALPEKC